jgi:hypothetical protein
LQTASRRVLKTKSLYHLVLFLARELFVKGSEVQGSRVLWFAAGFSLLASGQQPATSSQQPVASDQKPDSHETLNL